MRFGIRRKTSLRKTVNCLKRISPKSTPNRKKNPVMMTDEARLALALRDTLHLPPCLDLTELAGALKLSIAEVESDSFDGALLCSRHRLSDRILVKRGMREEGRKRFPIGHETGLLFPNGR